MKTIFTVSYTQIIALLLLCMFGLTNVNKAPGVGVGSSQRRTPLAPAPSRAETVFFHLSEQYIRVYTFAPKQAKEIQNINITEEQKSSHICRAGKERINHFQTCPVNKVSISRNRAPCPYSTFVSETVNVASSSLCKADDASSSFRPRLCHYIKVRSFVTSVTRFDLRALFGPIVVNFDRNRNGAR